MAGVSRDRPGSVGTSGSRGSSRDRGGLSTAGRVRSTSPREGSQKKKKKYVDWKTKNKDAYQEHTYWPKMYKT
jgi:ribosomal protein S30